MDAMNVSSDHVLSEGREGVGRSWMPQFLRRAIEDVSIAFRSDPAAQGFVEVLLAYPGVHAVLIHRVSNWLWRSGHRIPSRLLSQVARAATGVEIHPGATVGERLFIDHGMGVVIGETAEIGDDVVIYHGVTLGGTCLDPVKRHPTIGNGVIIGAGATVLGSFQVGVGARIGAGAVVVKAVPAFTTVVGPTGRESRRSASDEARSAHARSAGGPRFAGGAGI